MVSTYGFTTLNAQNSPNKTPNAGGIKGIVYGRVVDIILDDTHEKFDEYGGYAGLGTILFKSVKKPTTTPTSTGTSAIPYFPNIKNYPLIGEIVPILFLPSLGIGSNTNATEAYYLPPTNIWNNPHQNAFPSSTPLPDSQAKNYSQTTLGSPSVVSNEEVAINLGKTFEEKSNIHPLQVFEGDTILEGRWGNTIRLGSTVKDQNSWSSVGTNGDPIIILKAGSDPNNTEDAWIPEIEDVDKDRSSIYMTSCQQIPLKNTLSDYSSYTSYIPSPPDQYAGNQVLLNSGRLMFNANQDHIVLSSKLTISFNAGKGYNFDTPANFVVKTGTTIRLGDKQAPHPLLKGDVTIDILSDLVKELTKFVSLFKTTPSPYLPQVKAAAAILEPKLNALNNQLRTQTKSSKTFTK